jgi:U3 small nucleolar RNA-associated protein 13
LYLDEVIDVKFIGPTNTHALVCTNSESLKLLNLATG